MLRVLKVLSICTGCAISAQTAAEDQEIVDIELVLAVDVSRSMDIEEFELQRAGYIAALRDPDFVRAVQAGPLGRVAIAYFEWASTPRQESLVGWHVISGPDSADAFATQLEARPFSGFRGTSISGALAFAQQLIEQNRFEAPRRVIDISGDGPNNAGRPVMSARDAAVQSGVVINGLPILVRPSTTANRLDLYYAGCVIGGPGAFVLPIRQISEFATAIRRKLILEVSGVAPRLRPVQAQGAEPVNCLIGEIERQRYSDPYFPELDR
jgi:hypothetical protein